MLFPNVFVFFLHRNLDQTLQILSSLAALNTRFATQIVVLDGSAEKIRATFPQIPILEIAPELGEARAKNEAFRWALGKSFEWIFFLKSLEDIALLKQKSLKTLLQTQKGSLWLHRSVLERVGLFDESFFYLWATADFCARAFKAQF